MSILINGMDMPKGNSTKNVLIYSNGEVFTGHKDDSNYSASEFEPEQRWIPTRIAKPPKAGQYLVTKQQKTGVRQIATAYYNPSFDEWSGNGNFTKVLAWQQLPTPYTQE